MIPVFEINGLWYFYGIMDEPVGPYTNQEDAWKAYREYYSEYTIGGHNSDPVVFDYDKQLWCFWDETWAYAYGPYASEFLAHLNLNKYVRYLNDGN